MIYVPNNYTKFLAGTVIRQALLADADVRAIIGTRMWPLEKLEGSENGPYILYEMSDYNVEETKSGIYNDRISLWIGCISNDYDETMRLAQAVYKVIKDIEQYKDDTKKIVINKVTIIDLQQGFLDDQYQTTLKFRLE